MKSPFTLSFDDTKTAFAYQSDQALRRARWIFTAMGHEWLVRLGCGLAPWALRWHLPVEGLIRRTVFKLFCGGETLPEAGATARRLAGYGVGAILDYGVEAATGEQNYDETTRAFLRTVDYASTQPAIPFISLKVTAFAPFSLLEKIHRKETLSGEEEAAFQQVRRRIRDIVRRASGAGTGVLIDAEQSWIQGPVDMLATEMMRLFNRTSPVVYNTYQLYLSARGQVLEQDWEKARTEGYVLGAKLVRGAYLEKENARSAQFGLPPVTQPSKQATDEAYDSALGFAIDRLGEGMAIVIGTHNEASSMLAARLLHQRGLAHDHPYVHFSQLFGMSDHITFNLARAGYRVSKYLPYGPVRDVLPYLVRRARENTAISGQLGRELPLVREELLRRKLL